MSAISDIIGSGACVADFNLDSYPDIYAVNGSGFSHRYGKRWWWSRDATNALYQNNGDGTFEEVARRAGVADAGWGMGCAFGDYDNDGYPDLYVTNYGDNLLYHNNGNETFTDVTNEAGVGDPGWGTSISWLDYDLDGDLDLYVVNYIVFEKSMSPAEPSSAYKIIQPLLMNSGLFDGQANLLYRNEGNGRFTDVTEKAGVANAPGRGMGVISFDYDRDGDQDIYIANDKSRNVLYRNERDGTFTDVGGLLGVDSPLSGMGVTVGDYDNDGDLDIFSTYPQSETNILYMNLSVNGADHYDAAEEGFANVTVDAGLGEDVSVGDFGWSTEFVDIDNDGYLDLFVANGHGMVDFDNPQTTIGQANQVFRNRGDGSFSDVSGKTGKDLKALGSSRGVAIGDFDNDGDPDFFVINNNGSGQLLQTESRTGNHWINVRLVGTKSNRDALGARVTLRAGGLSQSREVRSGSGYLSQMDRRLAFGLGNTAIVDSLEVVWPSGLVQKLTHLEADRFIAIVEGEHEVASQTPVPAASGVNQCVRNIPSRQDGENKTQHAAPPRGDHELTLESVSALGQIPSDRSVQVLRHLLRSNDPTVRKTAARALGETGRMEAVSPLLILLKEERDNTVRREVLKALGGLPSGRTVGALVDTLFEGDIGVRRESARALSRLFGAEEKIFKSSMLKKREAVTFLLRALRDEDPSVRQYVIRALGLSESYRAVVPVTAALKDKDVNVRKEAARATGLLRDRRATPSLAMALRDPGEDSSVRVQALFALRRLGSDLAMQALFEAAASEDRETRLDSLQVILAALSDEESILVEKEVPLPLLESGMEAKDAEVRKAIVQIAGLLRRQGVEIILARGMRDESVKVRRQALGAARNLLQSDVLRSEVRRLTRDRNDEIRKQAVLALPLCSPEEQDIELLKELIASEPEEEMRLAAFSSLLQVSSNCAIPLIRKELSNRTSIIRDALVEVLGSTSDRSAISLLLDHLDKQEAVELQKGAAFSLRRFARDGKVSAALLEVVRDKGRDLEVRQAALSVLADLSRNSHRGNMIFPHISGLLRDKKDPLRQNVISSFADMGDKRAVDQLLRIFADTSEEARTRTGALYALVKLAPEKVLPEMERILMTGVL